MSKVIVIIGVSGVGKTTLIKCVMDNCENNIHRLLPITDRKPRNDEYFVERVGFDKLLAQGKRHTRGHAPLTGRKQSENRI